MNGYVVNNRGDVSFRPLRIRLRDPFQMALSFMADIHGVIFTRSPLTIPGMILQEEFEFFV